MAYRYDVFISYRRTPTTVQWLDEVLLQHFTDHLKEEANNPNLSVFIDRAGIENGDNWKDSIREAAARSKCLVPLFQPTYFQSEWCVRELAVFRHRHQALGLGNDQKLVFPVTINDGENFPAALGDTQQFEAQKCYRPLESLRGTSRYLEFLDYLIERWVPAIAAHLNQAPAWQPEWSDIAWTEPLAVFQSLYQGPPLVVAAPTLSE
jgi:hypothetical protein